MTGVGILESVDDYQISIAVVLTDEQIFHVLDINHMSLVVLKIEVPENYYTKYLF